MQDRASFNRSERIMN